MTDAPKRIWAYKWHQYETRNGPSQTEYIRADLHADLLRAADSLAGAVDQERNMTCQDFGMQVKASEVVGAALTAYKQAKEKTNAL